MCEPRPLVDPADSGGWTAFARHALGELADLIFPPLCPLCGSAEPGDGLGCSEHRLPSGPPGSRCGRCCAALAPSIRDGERCPGCRARSPGFESLVTLADYRAQSAVREWLLAFKHGGRRDLAVPLGRALGHVVGRHLSEPTILVPVPLHPWRRIERGYDQALELACEAAAVGPFEVCPVLKRTRATPPQGSLGAASRTANVRGAFRSRRLSRLIGTALPFQGRRVWLIDDVVTSGATVAACAKELRRLGASSVAVACVARASPHPGSPDSLPGALP